MKKLLSLSIVMLTVAAVSASGWSYSPVATRAFAKLSASNEKEMFDVTPVGGGRFPTVPAEDVLAGQFGGNVGGGDYSFPNAITAGAATFTGPILSVGVSVVDSNGALALRLNPGIAELGASAPAFEINQSGAPMGTGRFRLAGADFSIGEVPSDAFIDFSLANSLLRIGVGGRLISIGDRDGMGNATLLEVDDINSKVNIGQFDTSTNTASAPVIQFNAHANAINLDSTVGPTSIGDVSGLGNQTKFTLTDSTQTFAFQNGNVGIGTTSPQSALEVAEGYLQASYTSAGTPATADCDSNTERGRMVLDSTNFRLYVCTGVVRGWDYTVLNN